MSIRRDDIVSAVQARLAAITTTDGYHTTFSGHVSTWQPTPTELWSVVILPTTEDVIGQLTGDFWSRRLTLQIVVVYPGSTSATSVSQIVEDIYKAIGSDIKWSGYAINTNPIGCAWEVQQDEKRITGATITVEIDYRTGSWAES
jgi:hypothetical protein